LNTRLNREKKGFLNAVKKHLYSELPAGKAKQILDFATAYYRNVPVSELISKDIGDICGQALNAWDFLRAFKCGHPKISVYNPDLNNHKWQIEHTVVMILSEDKPFLVDSVRMELTRREIDIHSLSSLVAQVKRDKGGKLVDLVSIFDEHKSAAGYHTEALLYFEIDRIIRKKDHAELTGAISDILKDVDLVVSDFSTMKKKAGELIDDLGRAKPPVSVDEVKETQAYLEWLQDDRFTFLGYKEYEVVRNGDNIELKYIPGTGLGIARHLETEGEKAQKPLSQKAQQHILRKGLLSFSKSGTMSRVHRPAYPNMVSVRVFNEKGEVVGLRGFLGLYTLPVYTERTRDIPVIRTKIKSILDSSGLYPRSHESKDLESVLENFPRTELFQTDLDELFETSTGIAQIKERHQTRLFVRSDPYGKFYICLVYMPRESYNTETRHKIQDVLCSTLKAVDARFTTFFGESILVRTHFVLRTNPDDSPAYDIKELEQKVIDITRSWQDGLTKKLIEKHGETEGSKLSKRYVNAFPASYRDSFPPSTAVKDVEHLRSLSDENLINMEFHEKKEEGTNVARFDLFHAETPLPLSDIIPILENLGLKVIGEHPYKIVDKSGNTVWNHDFSLEYSIDKRTSVTEVADTFEEAFRSIWRGESGNDSYNRLVLAAGLDWRKVSFLRALGHYMKQIRVGFSQEYFADTLLQYTDMTKVLVEYFVTKFDPQTKVTKADRKKKLTLLENEYFGLLENVKTLSEDCVMRRYMEITKAILRTNYFQQDKDKQLKSYFSYKLNPKLIPEIPLPRPMFEIFVYSNRVEGVHLRGGKVARGGLRWSDRLEDYRTEVLGLVKAQQVKNSVIVPVGSKGGFTPKFLAGLTDRDAILQEGIACYKIFIRGLLDLTDNLVKGKVIPPKSVVRYDPDDPYLVVAADKGTATFSDISNGLADEYDFWLGDAFASGGSKGYDHKGMGITAKGAWVSVQRHFRERGINIQETPFTVLGIGDMAGDVFGNGMLLSDKIKLVAAFNHLHIFIDPAPNPEKSFAERQRLFNLPRSSWADYDAKLVSKGGGLFLRSAKSIGITPEMQKCFGLKAKSMTPNELLNALLKAPVDLIWNGGIGTYVKASSETHADVGDRANDTIRVNGNEVKALVVGEGGNLGLTQLGRLEVARNGASLNTDFIDNAGGVDCSDHEVNIKILLNSVIQNGELTNKQRNKLLVQMTDDVAGLVLKNNYRQAQALSIAQKQAVPYMNEYRSFISRLEKEGKLNRELEYLPSDTDLAARAQRGEAMTRPSLCLLISYAKAELKEALVDSGISEDTYIAREIETEFPPVLVSKYKKALYGHQLNKEIIATQLANDVVNNMGITFVTRMRESTGASFGQVLKAYVIARDIFGMSNIWQEIEALDNKVPTDTQLDMMTIIIRLVRHCTHWLLKYRKADGKVEPVINHFSKRIEEIYKDMPNLLYGEPLKDMEATQETLIKAGVGQELANRVASSGSLYFAMDIIEGAAVAKSSVKEVSRTFFDLSNRLEMHWFRQQINHIVVKNHWHAKVRDAFRDDVDWQLRSLTGAVLASKKGAAQPADKLVDLWLQERQEILNSWHKMLKELRNERVVDMAVYAVAIRKLMELERQG
jgi:glutamate dehydrogenase